jgi:hypothetical protein
LFAVEVQVEILGHSKAVLSFRRHRQLPFAPRY